MIAAPTKMQLIVKELRVSMKKSQYELAELLGIRPVSIHRYEQGVTFPPLPHLWRMADFAHEVGKPELAHEFLKSIGDSFQVPAHILNAALLQTKKEAA